MSCFKIKRNILKIEKEKEKAKQYSWAKGAESRKQRKQNLQKRKLRKQKTWQYWVSIEYSHRSFCKMDLSQVIPTRSLVVFVLNRNSSSFSGYIYIAQFLKTTSYILDLWILIHPLVDLDVEVFIICDRHTDAEFSQLILWNIEMEWRRSLSIRYICLFVVVQGVGVGENYANPKTCFFHVLFKVSIFTSFILFTNNQLLTWYCKSGDRLQLWLSTFSPRSSLIALL